MSARNGRKKTGTKPVTDTIADLSSQAIILAHERQRSDRMVSALEDAFQAVHDDKMFTVVRLGETAPATNARPLWQRSSAFIPARVDQFIRRGRRTPEQIQALIQALQAFKQGRLAGIRMPTPNGDQITLGETRPDFLSVFSQRLSELTDTPEILTWAEERGVIYVGESYSRGIPRYLVLRKLELLYRRFGLPEFPGDRALREWIPPYAADEEVQRLWASPIGTILPWVYGCETHEYKRHFGPILPIVGMYFSELVTFWGDTASWWTDALGGRNHALMRQQHIFAHVPGLHAGMLAPTPDEALTRQARKAAEHERSRDIQRIASAQTRSGLIRKRSRRGLIRYLLDPSAPPARFLQALKVFGRLTDAEWSGREPLTELLLLMLNQQRILDVRTFLTCDVTKLIMETTVACEDAKSVTIRPELNAQAVNALERGLEMMGLKPNMTDEEFDAIFG